MLNKDYLTSKVAKIEEWLIKVRRDFHQYPELGFQEYRTKDKIIKYLEGMNIKYKVVAKTGVVAFIEGKKKGKTVALRADIDGLPMEDKKGVPYKSKIKGRMHSCGHDAHTTILLGTGKVLNGLKNELKGNVKLIFQPAEESEGGAKPMIEEGVLENPYVDGIFGLHVDNSLQCGEIGIKYGQMKAASDMIKIIIYGKNSHGAYPQDGIDAISIASQVITALQTIVSRTIDPRSSAVVTIGTIKGGYGRNILADKVEMEGIVRALNEESRILVLNKIKDIVEGISQSMGGKGELIRMEGYTALVNNNKMVDIVQKNGVEILGEENIYEMPYPSFGVEDFAFFAAERPSAFFHLGSGNKEKGIVHKGHTPYFDIDEDSLTKGVILQTKNAIEFLKNDNII